MIDQLFLQAPDIVIVPIGCGTNIAAYAKGFREYYQLGLIDKIPQLIGVQAEKASTVVNSFQQRQKTVTSIANADTIASAIAVPNPIDGIKALDTIYSTRGCAVAVSDQEILQAQCTLAIEEGLFVETASAATIAALNKLFTNTQRHPRESGDPNILKIDSRFRGNDVVNKKIICILTGDGLKDVNVVLKAANKLITINPDEREFLHFYQNNHLRVAM
jgi:threonine synthase